MQNCQKYSYLQCLQSEYVSGKADTRDRTGLEGPCRDAFGRPDLYGSPCRDDRGQEEAPVTGRYREVEQPEEKGLCFTAGD